MNKPSAPPPASSTDVFTVGDWCVDMSTHRLTRDGKTIKLEPRATAVLSQLCEHAGEVVSRDSLEQQVWGELVVGYDALSITIRKLRKAFEDDPKEPRYIETIPKVGYRLIAEIGDGRRESTGRNKAQAGAAPPAKWPRKPWAAIAAVAVSVLIAVSVWLGLDERQAWLEDGSLPDKPSIVVMPFENLSSDQQQGYFVDGMTDDLITSLSKLSGVFVISRNSSFTYKGKSVKARQVARELGVQYMLEGSVRRDGDKVRVNAQLIDAVADRHLWAETYDGSMSDVFAVQDAVVGNIVAALAVNLADEGTAIPAGTETNVPEAYDAMLLAREHSRSQTAQSLARTISFLEKAIELDPGYGEAYARLADTYWRIHDIGLAQEMGYAWTQPRDLAREYIAKALEHPTSDAYAISAIIVSDTGNHDDALTQMDRAIALQPNNAKWHANKTYMLSSSGRAEEAERSVRLAMRLNPNYPTYYLRALGQAQFHQKRYEEAAGSFERAVTRQPDYPHAYQWLAATYGHMNRMDDAKRAIERCNELRRAIKLPPLTLQSRRDFLQHKNFDEQYLEHHLEGLRLAGVT